MKPSTLALALPAELEAELAALPPFTSYGNAVAVINPIRARYMTRLNSHSLAVGRFSDRFAHDIGEQLQRQCDRAIALNARKADKNHGPHGWTSVPVDCLTDAEKDALQNS